MILGDALSIAAALRTYDRGRRIIVPAFASDRPPTPTGRAGRPVDILLLGVDDQAGGDAGGSPAGMLTLVRIPADRHHVQLVSILRSAVVPIPGHGDRPIGAALALGGVPLQVRCVEHLLDLRVDHLAVIPLGVLARLTDLLGGVTVRNPSAFTSDGYAFPAGEQRLDGPRAVAFVRGSDWPAAQDARRVDAEHAYLRGALSGLLGAERLHDRVAVARLLTQLIPDVQVDAGLDAATVTRLGFALRGLRPDRVQMLALPTGESGAVGGEPLTALDARGLAALRRHLHEDTLHRYAP